MPWKLHRAKIFIGKAILFALARGFLYDSRIFDSSDIQSEPAFGRFEC